VMAPVLQGLQHQAGVLGDVGLVGGRGDPTGADGGLSFMTHTVGRGRVDLHFFIYTPKPDRVLRSEASFVNYVVVPVKKTNQNKFFIRSRRGRNENLRQLKLVCTTFPNF
jgi:hypothetical protein